MKLWGGRFEREPDREFALFNSSFSFDRRLIEADIEASVAHAEALASARLLTEDEAAQITAGLLNILHRVREEEGYLEARDSEDVHSFVEQELVSGIGDVGYKLHTGRSRNDQVATDLRLFLRGEIDEIDGRLRDLQRALVELADGNRSAVMPGYTHLQRAQPVLFAHYVLAYFEMLARDRERFKHARARVNRLPLGSGALAGTGFPLDREKVANRLGFDGLCENSIDAVSDRDFVIEFVGTAAIAMMHLSRLAEDFIIYSTAEFGFIQLSDAVSTGSSLMPQKKNPDSLELIRGKAARVFGHSAAMLSLMKSLPLSYNKDMQEDKEALFDTIDTVKGSLSVMTTVIRNITIDAGRMLEAARVGYLNATDLADYLVRKGVAFRKAHELVGRIVLKASESGKPLEQLSLDDYKRFAHEFGEDLYSALSIESSLASKAARGGTSPAMVEQEIGRARSKLDE